MSCMRDIIPIYNSLNVCLNSATTVFTKDRESSQLLNFLIPETKIISQFYFSCLLRYVFLLISFTELKLESPYISCFYFRKMSLILRVFIFFFSFLFLTSLDITQVSYTRTILSWNTMIHTSRIYNVSVQISYQRPQHPKFTLID